MVKNTKCEHFLNLICETLEKDIDSSFCIELQDHLRECPDCCSHIESMRHTVAFCRKLVDEDVPTDVDKLLWDILDLKKPD